MAGRVQRGLCIVMVASAAVLLPVERRAGEARGSPGSWASSPRDGGAHGFWFSAAPLPERVRDRAIGRSWRPGCPVSLDRLRYVRVTFWGFDGRRHLGELVVNESVVRAVRTVFARLYNVRFPIRRMRLVDVYDGNDYASIEAGNTSAFNCRRATGSKRWSEHAYGVAIDVNPIENPYVFEDRTTSHAASRRFLDRRKRRRGMAHAGGALVRAFGAVGWRWGGSWSGPWDYQHFSASGR